jgi:regulator of replication initiation timing
MSEIEQLQQKIQELSDERDIFARTLDKRDHEIDKLSKELNRARDTVDLWASEVNILEFENKRLRGLLYEAFSTKNR